MGFQIDAWFERRDPIIRIRDTRTGREILRLEAEQVRALMESGDICVSDLENGAAPCAPLIALAEKQAAIRDDPTRRWVRGHLDFLRTDSASAKTFNF